MDIVNQAAHSMVASPLMIGIDYNQALFDELPFAQFFEFDGPIQEQVDYSGGVWEESSVVNVASHVD